MRKPSISPTLRACLDAAKQARAAEREAARPVLAARRALTGRVRRLRTSLSKAKDRLHSMMVDPVMGQRSEQDARWIYGLQFTTVERRLTDTQAALSSVECDLALFDALHAPTTPDSPE